MAIAAVLALELQIIAGAEDFSGKDNVLFLGRGINFPIALEGAFKGCILSSDLTHNGSVRQRAARSPHSARAVRGCA